MLVRLSTALKYEVCYGCLLKVVYKKTSNGKSDHGKAQEQLYVAMVQHTNKNGQLNINSSTVHWDKKFSLDAFVAHFFASEKKHWDNGSFSKKRTNKLYQNILSI